MSTTVTGYTGIEIDGKSSNRTGLVNSITLAAGDVTLTRTQSTSGFLVVATGHATNAIVLPVLIATEFVEGGTASKFYTVKNSDASLAATIKVAGGTGIVVAATKTAIVALNAAGTDFVRITADA